MSSFNVWTNLILFSDIDEISIKYPIRLGNPVLQGKGGLSYTAVKITPCSLHNDFVVSEPDLPEKSKQSSIKGSNHTQLSKDFVYRQMTLKPTNYCCCQFNHFLDLKMIILNSRLGLRTNI